ncbi:hypothetical protein CDAR_526551 [Caerostris darwini]|uniref:Uncharacterized protein n=1 Tax=Caerostris darwini TaxID=1538125 RepID=A0AAV4T3R8_9ARAC|nr:hypothetical protein CDAR_526551 [Caerostris darwini]
MFPISQKLASVTEFLVPDPSTNETSLETILIKIRKKRSLFNKYLHFDVQPETPQLNYHLVHNASSSLRIISRGRTKPSSSLCGLNNQK